MGMKLNPWALGIATIILVALPASAANDVSVKVNVAEKSQNFIERLQNRLSQSVARFQSVVEKRQRDFRADRVIVKYKGDKNFQVLKLKSENVDDAITRLTSSEDVEYAEPDFVATAFDFPNHPFFFFYLNF